MSKNPLSRLFARKTDGNEKKPAVLNSEEREMIQGIVDLSDSIVREIMVPRTDAIFIDINTPKEKLLSLVIETGYSRFPVFKNRVDNIAGILYAKDLLRYLVNNERDFDLSKIIKPPYFVPESKKLNSLLREFKKRKVHIAVVVDEYGGTSGIICLEDVIEEIVGDIQDEFDHEPEDVLKIGEGVYLCDARIKLDLLNARLPAALPADDFDSLGGFVFDLFGKIPEPNESVTYENRMDFIVHRMEGRKILSVKIIMKKDDNKGTSKN